MADIERCDRPPDGWICSREVGHDGPCAAREVEPMSWEETARSVMAEKLALQEQIAGAVEALYSAHEFIKSVTHWDGQQDDQEEVLARIEKALPDPPVGGR